MKNLMAMAFTMAAAGLLAACAPTTRVVLLPQANGSASAVEVKSASNVQLLSQPYQTADVFRSGLVRPGMTDAQAAQTRYAAVLAELPAPEERFLLYFELGGTQLTAESQVLLPAILLRASQRRGGEIIVTGHTDRVGALTVNDALSLQRARAIRELLVAQGFKPELVDAVGRGEREPLVPTEDEVDEPRNRRVEIVVR
jgi:outer membrane protein OmpA-like peptidoglycan-associated protein